MPVTVANASKANTAGGPFAVADTAANVLGGLASLAKYANLNAISLTGGGTVLAASAAQYSGYAAVLDLLAPGFSFTVAGLGAGLAAAAQADAHCSGFTVTDTATNLAGNLAALAADGKLSGFTISGGNTLTVTAAQYLANKAFLGKIAATQSLVVTGATLAEATQVATDSHVSSITVADTDVNLAANLGTLAGLKGLGAITVRNTSPDWDTPIVSVSAGDWVKYQATLDRITGNGGYLVNGLSVAQAAKAQADRLCSGFYVIDTAANIGANLATLAADTALWGITMTGSAPTLALTGALAKAYGKLIGGITNAGSVVVTGATAAQAVTLQGYVALRSYTLSDTSANVMKYSAALSYAKLAGVTLTDVKQVTLSWDQYTANQKLYDAFTGTSIALVGLTVAQAAQAQANGHIAAFSVTDDFVNLGENTYAQLMAATKLTAVNLPAGQVGGAWLDAAFDYKYLPLLDKFGPGNNWFMQGATAAQALVLAADAHCDGFGVVDTAANISARLDALNAAIKAFHPPAPGLFTPGVYVSVSDGAPVAMTLAQFNADKAVVNLIGGPLSISGVSAGLALDYATGNKPVGWSYANHVGVSDTLANVLANLDTLENLAKAGLLNGITLTDSGKSATIGTTLAATDKEALALISGKYTLATSSKADSGFHLVLDYGDPSMLHAPTEMKLALAQVVMFFESHITSNETVTIGVKLGAPPGAGGSMDQGFTANHQTYGFATVKAAYAANASGPTEAAVLAAMTKDPTGGGTLTLTSAEAKALGLTVTGSGPDGTITMGTPSSFGSYNYSQSPTPYAKAFDFIGQAERQIAEVLGHEYLGEAPWTELDLLRYTAPGVLQSKPGQAAYLSVNGGKTSLGAVDGLIDAGWSSSTPDAMASAFLPGVLNPFSGNDLMVLNALGYHTV